MWVFPPTEDEDRIEDGYCALCGVVFCQPSYSPDRTRGPALDWIEICEHTGWLEVVETIGENLKPSTEPDSVGIARHVFNPFERPSVELFGRWGRRSDPCENATRYCWDPEHGYPWVAAYHTSCYRVLRDYLDVSSISKAAFYATLKSFAKREVSCNRLAIDYGDVAKFIQEYSDMPRQVPLHDQYLFIDPSEIPSMQVVLHEIEEDFRLETPTTHEVRAYATVGDPFHRLSPELLLLIARGLLVADLYKLRNASPTFANLPLSNRFWKRRLDDDMPWLPRYLLREVGQFDWKQIYHRLWCGSSPQATELRIDGLCNRRRIWEQLCPIFAEAYWEYSASESRDLDTRAVNGVGEEGEQGMSAAESESQSDI